MVKYTLIVKYNFTNIWYWYQLTAMPWYVITSAYLRLEQIFFKIVKYLSGHLWVNQYNHCLFNKHFDNLIYSRILVSSYYIKYKIQTHFFLGNWQSRMELLSQTACCGTADFDSFLILIFPWFPDKMEP